MLRIIEVLQSDRGPESGHGLRQDGECPSPIIKRSTIERDRAVIDTLLQAQARANALMARAEQDAVEMRAVGFRDGLQRGVYAALAPLSGLIAQWEAVRSALREDAAEAMRASLGELAARAPMLVAMLDAIMDTHFPPVAQKVHIRVPPGADRDALGARCEALGLNASIEEGTGEDAFSIAWDGHVWTARLDEIADALTTHTRHAASLPAVDADEICRGALLEAAQGFSGES